jgi:hypothetical protein
MRDEDGDRGWPDGAPGVDEARRKLHNLLAGRFLLYELTGDRQMVVLSLPRRVTPTAAPAGRPSRRAAGGAPPAA